ncbi:hypothetical protein BDN72DRAFT_761830 [Pluteus cervinus]|uniref:Uncharacterized protein n=1 Tax=Pluteus cervinus TaxID=181527 RepID=A0ACD3B5Y2_9AGAR|nr:hypothetical protein BDN72DRAFT_761830 [Pluteus cervinus]
MSFNGHIDVHRRRTLRDGRVKLKISLCDVAVDKCGLCMKQFRQGEPAELNTICRHAFHQLCLKRHGLERQCPLCPEAAPSNAYSR